MASSSRDQHLLALIEAGDAARLHSALASLSAGARNAFLAGQSASSAAGAGRYPKLPLHWAAEKGEAKVVETLISFGARVNAKGGIHESTPVHLAAGEGHEAVLEILLD
ncbi:myotrophin-like, partial [Penaeus monodon]|uniref:myotrophin-like n=1 Tax=Penaeus monodon TaxID=6687 RepID=UPI0018A71878